VRTRQDNGCFRIEIDAAVGIERVLRDRAAVLRCNWLRDDRELLATVVQRDRHLLAVADRLDIVLPVKGGVLGNIQDDGWCGAGRRAFGLRWWLWISDLLCGCRPHQNKSGGDAFGGPSASESLHK